MADAQPHRQRKTDYPYGIPLRPPPGWRGPSPTPPPPPPFSLQKIPDLAVGSQVASTYGSRAGNRRKGKRSSGGLGLPVQMALLGLMVSVCMAVGWLSVTGWRSKARPRSGEVAVVDAPETAKAREPRKESPVARQPEPPAKAKPARPEPAVQAEETPSAAVVASPVAALTAGPTLTYEEHILPIMERSCIRCHGPRKKRGGLDLSTFAAAVRGGEDGPAVQKGKPESSSLLETIVTGKMPPSGAKLPERDIQLIRQWIHSGAKSRSTP